MWCRDKDNQFGTFAVREEQCHATYALASHLSAVNQDRDAATRAAVQTAVRFREGHKPDLTAGLDLPESGDAVQHGGADR